MALTAFISPFIALIAFFVGFEVGLAPVDLMVLFGTALLADIFGIVALNTGGINRVGKRLAGSAISLGILSMVAEILRIIIQH